MTAEQAKPKIELPKPIPEEGVRDGRGPKWITVALHAQSMPVDGAYSYRSDDVEETAIVIKLTGHGELLFRPARMIVSRRLTEVFSSLGCEVPYYTPGQIQVIGQALGRLARNTRDQVEQTRSEIEFSAIGAEWIERSRLHLPPLGLSGREGRDVRPVIERIRKISASASEQAPPPLVFDIGANEILIARGPFRRYVRERRGTTSDELIGVQMERVGWRRRRLAARPAPGQSGTPEIGVWAVPNGWQGITVDSPATAGDSADSPDSRCRAFEGPTRARAQARMRGLGTNALQRPTGGEEQQ